MCMTWITENRNCNPVGRRLRAGGLRLAPLDALGASSPPGCPMRLRATAFPVNLLNGARERAEIAHFSIRPRHPPAAIMRA
jgi:hypothetical protein